MNGEPVTRSVEVETDVANVWLALTDASLLSEWFEAEASLEARIGGAVAFRFPDGSERRGVVVEFEEPRRIAFRWRDPWRSGGPSVVGFELEELPSGARVTVTESPGVLARDVAEAAP
jgi:uncharacterized protein YndB with AHSA1/START domain